MSVCQIWSLQKKTVEFKKRLADGKIWINFCEAYAVVREADKEDFRIVPLRCQVMGSNCPPPEGNIAEMATGEGKTDSDYASLSKCLVWSGAMLVTPNSYLALRDAKKWVCPPF